MANHLYPEFGTEFFRKFQGYIRKNIGDFLGDFFAKQHPKSQVLLELLRPEGLLDS